MATKLKIRFFIPGGFIALILLSCSNSEEKRITNSLGGYAINVPAAWKGVIEDSSTTISQTRTYGEASVTGTATVSIIYSEYESLEESMTSYVSQLSGGFADYRRVSGGRTQLNGISARPL